MLKWVQHALHLHLTNYTITPSIPGHDFGQHARDNGHCQASESRALATKFLGLAAVMVACRGMRFEALAYASKALPGACAAAAAGRQGRRAGLAALAPVEEQLGGDYWWRRRGLAACPALYAGVAPAWKLQVHVALDSYCWPAAYSLLDGQACRRSPHLQSRAGLTHQLLLYKLACLLYQV